jgi:hydroxymethylbilane synthase
MKLRLGSRESPLALAQTHQVVTWLNAAWPDLTVEIQAFKTQGDLILDTALSKIGDKGLFVKELEHALLANQIDLAIHSMKDMPGTLPDGLILSAVGPREDPRDVLVGDQCFENLPPGAVVGTSSLRRVAQLKRRRPDLYYQTVRGNLNTRLRKLDAGEYQALVLAAAGLKRLGMEARIQQYFDPVTENIPAVAQGILGAECRQNDAHTQGLLAPLAHPEVLQAAEAERAVLARLQGGCQLPLGAHLAGNTLHAIVLNPDGTRVVTATEGLNSNTPKETGERLAEKLLALGASEILDQVRQHP